MKYSNLYVGTVHCPSYIKCGSVGKKGHTGQSKKEIEER